VGANSAALCGPDGAWVGGYRKSHLFDMDIPWAKAGRNSVMVHISICRLTVPSRHGLCDV
jgi:predicted amidohydrolase